MFRAVRLPRRQLLAAAAVAVAINSPQEKLGIYSRAEPVITLQESPSELERQIGKARRAVTSTYGDAYARVQGVVSSWIGVEQAVEKRVKSLIDPEEPLTPGILYVGVATLTGSVLARNRLLLWRLALPPTLLLLSLNHFLPKTTHNISSYLSTLEETYFPTLAEKHAIANAHTRMTWERAKEATQNGRERISQGLVGAIDKAQEVSGLKLKETLGLGTEAVAAAKVGTQHAVEVVEEKAEEAKEFLESKAEGAREAVVEKIEDASKVVAEQKNAEETGTKAEPEEVKRLV
ncbi:unnamed protein product [Somion occarium]|uniref:MICOS complex subunit n=1 Tax=Somion occarium TaxID=3059160 RepID=A0ABP1CRY4_9APHY